MDDEVSAGARQFAFLPWLRLKEPCRAGGVEFLPWREKSGSVTPALADAAGPLASILSGYVDHKAKRIDNCVVATVPSRGWNLADSDFESVRWATALLFLATWASNEYYARFAGSYVNSSAFRVVWQRFVRTPVWVSLTSRRRDGRTWDAGYKHGEVAFSLPLQCSVREPAVIDEALLAALDSGNAADCETIKRLRRALPFVDLANTDDDLMTEIAEAILMGSAFEQLLRGDASAYKLGKKFGQQFMAFGRITVAEAKGVRPGVEIDQSVPDRTAAQSKWWVHRKWIEELYDVRSKSVHQGAASGRTWGWDPAEHLVMAAWVFPLVVKLLLQQDGHYNLTDTDKGHCLAVDKLLAATGWADDAETGSKWHHIVSETQRRHASDRVRTRVLKLCSHLFGDETSESETDESNGKTA